MKKKLLSFLALASFAIVTFASTQALRAAADDAHILWSSWTPVVADWGSDAIKVNPDKFEVLKVGDILHVVITDVTPSDPWSAQVGIKDGTWADLEETVPVGTGDVTDASFLVTGDMLTLFKEYGLIVSGNNYSATQVYYEDGTLTGSEKSIWIGNTTDKPRVSSYHFTIFNLGEVKAGDIIRVTASAIPDFGEEKRCLLSYSGEDTGWVWTNYEGMPATATATGFDFVVNADNVDQIKKDGIIVNQQGYTITQVELLESYAVNIATGITGGTVSVDKTVAAEGDEVTITATPDEGNKVMSITVKDAEDQAVTVTNGKFKMPAKAVTVSATFNKFVDVTISPASGDISTAVEEAIQDKLVKSLTVNLTAGKNYTVSKPITTGVNLTINGSGATIDASGNDGNFIELKGSKEKALKADGTTESDHFLVNAVTIKDVTVTGLKKAIIRDTQKTYLKTLTIDNSVIEASNGSPAIDFDSKGYVGQLNVTKSTIWAKEATNKNFTKYGSSPKNLWTKDGDGKDVLGEYTVQGYDVQNSTFVNIATGQNFCNNSLKGTAQNVYTVKNNVFVDCGKTNQVVVGFNSGQVRDTPAWDVDGNIFNCAGADGSAAEVNKAGKKNNEDIVKNSIAGVITFPKAATGEFNGTLGSVNAFESETTSVGDPRWTLNNVKVPTAINGINADSNAIRANGKYFKNGRLIIVKDGKEYTTSGTMVK